MTGPNQSDVARHAAQHARQLAAIAELQPLPAPPTHFSGIGTGDITDGSGSYIGLTRTESAESSATPSVVATNAESCPSPEAADAGACCGESPCRVAPRSQPDAIDIMAIGHCGRFGWQWDKMTEQRRDLARSEMWAIVGALAAAGYSIVPTNPTEAMGGLAWRAAYWAMVERGRVKP